MHIFEEKATTLNYYLIYMFILNKKLSFFLLKLLKILGKIVYSEIIEELKIMNLTYG